MEVEGQTAQQSMKDLSATGLYYFGTPFVNEVVVPKLGGGWIGVLIALVIVILMVVILIAGVAWVIGYASNALLGKENYGMGGGSNLAVWQKGQDNVHIDAGKDQHVHLTDHAHDKLAPITASHGVYDDLRLDLSDPEARKAYGEECANENPDYKVMAGNVNPYQWVNKAIHEGTDYDEKPHAATADATLSQHLHGVKN